MTGKAFDIRLIPESSGTTTDIPIAEWIKNMELVCELCAMDRVEHVLRDDYEVVPFPILNKKRADPEERK